MSQLSISQQKLKKTKTVSTSMDTFNNDASSDRDNLIYQSQNDSDYNDTILETDTRGYTSPYLKVSDKIFKQMLSQAVEDGEQLIRSLDTHDKLQLVRQITELTHKTCYFGLQRDLWQDYYNLGLKHGNIWAPRLPKSLAKQLHTCVTYGFPKHIIEKRQQTIHHQIERTISELSQHLNQLHTLTQQWQPPINFNLLSTAIDQCVNSGQGRLRQEFDYRRKILEHNVHDRQLITMFYNLQPSEEQVCYYCDLIQNYWAHFLGTGCTNDMVKRCR